MTCYISFRDVQFTQLWNGYQIVVTTDVPCHLYMRWSHQQPWVHTIPAYRRGLAIPSETYYCFTVYTDNEQDEAGDTLTHTFIKTPWVHCETRWFHFWGKQAGISCVSTSPVFKIHFDDATAPPGPVQLIIPAEYSARTISSWHGTWANAWDGRNLTIRGERQKPTFILQSAVYEVVTWHIERVHLSFPIPELLTLHTIDAVKLSLYIASRDMVATPLCVTEGAQHDPLLHDDWKPQKLMTTIFAQNALNTLNLNAYNDFIFDAAAKLWLKAAAEPTHQFESFDSGQNANASCFGNQWLWQSFTPDQDHPLSVIKLKLKRKAGLPKIYYVDIHEGIAPGEPVGPVLATGEFDCGFISNAIWGEWITFRLYPTIQLQKNKLYTFVLRSPLSNATNYCQLTLATAGLYVGGRSGYSLDGGSTWDYNPVNYDYYFIEYNHLNYGLAKFRIVPTPDVSGAEPPPAFSAKSTFNAAQDTPHRQPLLYIDYSP